MAVSITSAIFRKDGKEQELKVVEVDLKSYQSTYKNNLFCTTPDCNAKLAFVFRTAKPSYFRTWKKENHTEECLFHFERIAARLGVSAEQTISVVLSSERKKNALKEAYRLAKMSDEEKEKQKNKTKKPNKKKPKTIGKKEVPAIKIVSTNEEEDVVEGEKVKRGPNILKRTADAFNVADIGKHRLLIGEIKDITFSEKSAFITTIWNRSEVLVKFEEVFFANSPEYNGLFHNIERYINEYQNVILTAIGEVRRNRESSGYELVVFSGDGFTIEDMSLQALAAHYSRKSLE
ncbi:hypothetical protein M1K46_02350 [Fictibacillus sp. WQ 8-8]|uniref:hypothetical protein n=1 Tax=Fictibacillus sp. WQ 8-8 TaxID=2938788 RepID=UPI00210E5E79|nr:hypothetical protein [Fictibacillus sp. WQ 8-8]MCQ6264507.1 hypothetical protein [Fictibacillus sp. WQ 8-8]